MEHMGTHDNHQSTYYSDESIMKQIEKYTYNCSAPTTVESQNLNFKKNTLIVETSP